MAHHDEASTYRRGIPAVDAPEFLEVTEDREINTSARRVPPYSQPSSRVSLTDATMEDLPRRRAPRSTPADPYAAEPLSQSMSTHRRAEGSEPKRMPVPSAYPAPREIAPAKRDAVPSAYPAPREIAPAKRDAVPSAYPAPREVAPAKRDAVPSAYPAPREIAPAKRDAVPSAYPAPREIAPAKRDAVPSAYPAPREVAPAKRDAVPSAYPAPREISPAKREAVRAETEASQSAPSAPSQTRLGRPAGREDARSSSRREDSNARELSASSSSASASRSSREDRSSSSSRSSREDRSSSSSRSSREDRSSSRREDSGARELSASSSRSRSSSSSSSRDHRATTNPASPAAARHRDERSEGSQPSISAPASARAEGSQPSISAKARAEGSQPSISAKPEAPSVKARAEGSQPSISAKPRTESGATPLPAPPPGPAATAAPAAPEDRPSGDVRPSGDMRPSADMPGMIDPLQVPVPPEMAPTIYSWIRRLALQADLPTADRVIRDALLELSSSLSVSVIYPGQDGLWTLGGDEELPKETAPIIACAQARRALFMSHHAMIPIVTTTETVGVIILQRNPRNPGYHPLESIASIGFIREAAAILHHLAISHIQKQTEIAADKGSLYRGEALEAHRSRGNEGVPVALSPSWVRRAYPFLCIAVVIALIFCIFIKVPTYSAGMGTVVIEGTPVTTPMPGNVSQLSVVANQKVKKGSVILRLDASAELAELQSAKEEEDAFSATYLFEQHDENNKRQLLAASQKVEALKKRIEQKTVRAKEDGVISDIRARIGEPLQQGEPICSIVQEGSDVDVITFLNAKDRPRLKPGMNMKVNLAGYTKAPDTAKISYVGSEAISPEAAAKYLNPTLAGSMKLPPGAYILVRGRMPSRTFVSQNQKLWYHHGMTAKIDVKINEKPFLVTLIPALEKYLVE